MSRLQVILASTRPGRNGAPVAQWFVEHAKQQGSFDVELVDLKEVGLPMIDEPYHPSLKKYQHEHTRAWSQRVSQADAYVFVLCEYNHGVPPALVNALNYVYHEWTYKPAGICSYGGVAGGARSANMLTEILVTLKVVPIPETVTIPFIDKNVQDGKFTGGDVHGKAAGNMLKELRRWSDALATLR